MVFWNGVARLHTTSPQCFIISGIVAREST